MRYRTLGATGIQVSELSFGAGPVAALFTDDNAAQLQRETISRALTAGINWFDTAPTYGAGQSEKNLGIALADLGASNSVHLATKVRLQPEHFGNIKDAVRSSLRASRKRLQRSRVTLIQLHNAITKSRGDLPASITPQDILSRGGVLKAFEELKADGLVEHFGLCGLGDTEALAEVIQAGPWSAIQVCHSILHPRWSRPLSRPEPISDQADSIVAVGARQHLGVIAIRVLAGGALAGQPPSAHTQITKFFPLAIYEEDQVKTARLSRIIPEGMSVKELAFRYVLSDEEISTALIGFANPAQIDEAMRFAMAGPLAPELMEILVSSLNERPGIKPG